MILTKTLNLPPLSEATREVMWNVSHPANSVVMYSLFALSMLIFCWGFWRRWCLWRDGKRVSLGGAGVLRRAVWSFNYIFLFKGVNREKNPALFHSLIFWGFLVLVFTTTVVAIDDYLVRIYYGPFYIFVTVLSDFFGVFLLIGLLIAYQRRYLSKPDRLHSAKSDFLMLFLLALMVVQGYILEGLRIQATNDPWALYSPVGYAFALLFSPFSISFIKGFHFFTWWFHTLTVFVFIALIPYTKFLHIFTSSANLFFNDFSKPKGALKNPGDIEKMMEQMLSAEDEAEFAIGAGSIKDLNWKQRLDLDACTSCGRCQSVCPAYNSGKILSPKWLILDTRDHMLSLFCVGELASNGSGPAVFFNSLDRKLIKKFTLEESLARSRNGNSLRSANELVQKAAIGVGSSVDAGLAGGVLEEDVFWSCTTCGACIEVCPVGIQHVDLITDVRRSMALMEGKVPSEAQPTLRAIETRGNPFGAAEARSEWCEGFDVPTLNEGDEVEVLYWVGCVSSFDKRKQKIAQAMSRILNASGVSWGTLGNRECCTGDPARRLGEENLFQTSVKQNIATLQSVKFKTIVTNCPHCFNSLKNEYPDFGSISESEVRIVHHSVYIKELIDSGKISINSGLDKEITYHDPCYLGRYNDTYDEPRDLLVRLGSKPKEMAETKERGKCCGAGGGHYWFDMKVGQRVNVQRIEQASDTGACVIAAGCPFCMQMLEDGIKIAEKEESLSVKDVAELVAENLSSSRAT